MDRRLLCGICAVLLLAAAPSEALAAGRLSRGPGGEVYEASFDVERFVLPEEAQALVVVEGTFDSECKVHAYEKEELGWSKILETDGWLGHNGLSNDRTMGDQTTPIGVFQMNTPFGQSEMLEGFPQNYIQVDETYVWTDETNVLSQDLRMSGERVGTEGFFPNYEYVIDMGYNKNAIADKGAALFIHCKEENEDGTAGCVAVGRDQMIQIMQLYGKYGDGHCFIALAPFGTFDLIYETYGVNDGLSPDGLFSADRGPGWKPRSEN